MIDGEVLARPRDPIILSPGAIVHQILLLDLSDVALAKIGNVVTVQRASDDVVSALAVAPLLPACVRVPEIGCRHVLESLGAERLIVGAAMFQLAQQLDGHHCRPRRIALTRAAFDIAPHALHRDAALPYRVLHIIAQVQRDASISQDHFIVGVGHTPMLGALR